MLFLATHTNPTPPARTSGLSSGLQHPYLAKWSVACRPLHADQPFRNQRLLNHRPIRHPGHLFARRVSLAAFRICMSWGLPSRRAHLCCWEEGSIWPFAHAGDPAQVRIVEASKRLQLLVREAAVLRQSVEKHWNDICGQCGQNNACEICQDASIQAERWSWYAFPH